jgi:hypothetical protein
MIQIFTDLKRFLPLRGEYGWREDCLAAADWCEERGETPRAQYLRDCGTAEAARLGMTLWGGINGLGYDMLEDYKRRLPFRWIVTIPRDLRQPPDSLWVGIMRRSGKSIYVLRCS